ncbi:hypothetical protein SESBI_49643 [Sesbania bispinosa]|nr:hypothetical protein SESBI_49643 [Sesbania bispinosa]
MPCANKGGGASCLRRRGAAAAVPARKTRDVAGAAVPARKTKDVAGAAVPATLRGRTAVAPANVNGATAMSPAKENGERSCWQRALFFTRVLHNFYLGFLIFYMRRLTISIPIKCLIIQWAFNALAVRLGSTWRPSLNKREGARHSTMVTIETK